MDLLISAALAKEQIYPSELAVAFFLWKEVSCAAGGQEGSGGAEMEKGSPGGATVQGANSRRDNLLSSRNLLAKI